MAIDPKFIGLESEERHIEVEKGQLKLFATAVGEANAVYSDEAAARAAGYPSIPAPPTFAFSLNLLAPAKIGNVTTMIENIGAVLHGEQQFEYHRMIFAGDRIRLKTKTADIYQKKGGKLDFIVQDSTAHNQHGELCVTSRMTLVVRN
jgi:acyl dehydratase